MLLSPPFEPIWSIGFKELTQKTAFLLTLAAGLRCGEVHALSFDRLQHKEDWSEVYLQPTLLFLAKNQSSHHLSQQRCFTVKALTSFTGMDSDDRKLCPVRALRMYLSKTRDRRARQKQKHLFLSLNPGRSQDITKSAIALWLRQLIVKAHREASDGAAQLASARPHEIRSLASSIAYDHSLSLSAIMQACTWKNSSTFTSFYLRDVARVSQELHSLPPFIAANVLHQARK
mgnify:CR=1 FL=1